MCVRATSILGRAAMLAAVLAPPGAALAQADPALVTALAECRALDNDRMRLACFDDVVVRVGGVAEPVRRADVEVPPVAAPAAAEAPAAENGERSRRRAAAREEAEAASAQASAEASAEIVTVTIVEVGVDGLGRTRFVTDEGAVFRQTDGRARRLPETPFEASVRGGALGSSFLVIPGGRDIRVTQRD